MREAKVAFDEASTRRAALVTLVRLGLMPARHFELLRDDLGEGVVPYLTSRTHAATGDLVLDVVWPQQHSPFRQHQLAVAAGAEAARWDATLVALATNPDAPLPS